MPEEKNKLQTALTQLEQIVDNLSNKEVDVQAGLEQFKKGVTLIKFCRGELKQAENQFQKLKAELEAEDNSEPEDLVEDEELPVIKTKAKQEDINVNEIPF